MRSPAEPVGIALLHPQGAWVEALECLLLERPDVNVVIAHTSPDWIRGALEHGVDVLVLGVSEERGFLPSDIERLRAGRDGLGVVVVSDSDDSELFVAAFRAGARAWLDPSSRVDES